jgi:hypothetical protein
MDSLLSLSNRARGRLLLGGRQVQIRLTLGAVF